MSNDTVPDTTTASTRPGLNPMRRAMVSLNDAMRVEAEAGHSLAALTIANAAADINNLIRQTPDRWS